VTIATAMAGRGTDIRLGGARGDPALRDRVVAAGGLLVIGTEHHEHRRIDAQLRGRAGRQGDPGRSVFHASLEDDLLEHGRMTATAIGDIPIDPAIAKRLVATAQKRRETRSFDHRMALLRFEAVIERQRETVYSKRRAIRDDPGPVTLVHGLRNDTIDDLMERFAPAIGAWDTTNLDAMVRSILTIAVPITPPSGNQKTHSVLLRKRIGATADHWMQGKVEAVGPDTVKDVLRRIMMAVLDQLWAEQSERLEHLKRAVELRRLAPHKVLAEFQVEAFALFEIMMREFRHEVTAHAMRLGKLRL
jgi:preprotein translocase subunit SecA